MSALLTQAAVQTADLIMVLAFMPRGGSEPDCISLGKKTLIVRMTARQKIPWPCQGALAKEEWKVCW